MSDVSPAQQALLDRLLTENVAPRKVGKNPALAAPYGETAEKIDIKDEMAWMQERSRRGWVSESLVIILYEFIKEKKLFGELLAFVKKRK